MKNLFLAAAISVFGFANAQSDAFTGKDDLRYQIGASFQDGGTGM